METETVKKTQTERLLEIKNLGLQTESTEAKLSNRVERWKRVSDTEDTIEEMEMLNKEYVKSKDFLI